MLVLTRKSHEQIQIGDNITITILRVKGGAIRVGIEAPKSLSVLRKEIVGKPVARTAAASEASEAEAPASIDVPTVAAKPRQPSLHAGGKATTLPTASHENPLRSRTAAPLGRYLATAGSR